MRTAKCMVRFTYDRQQHLYKCIWDSHSWAISDSSLMAGSLFSSDDYRLPSLPWSEKPSNIGMSLFIYGNRTLDQILDEYHAPWKFAFEWHCICNEWPVAVAASQPVFGDIGTYLIAGLIMISTFGCINGMILWVRVYYSMAKDGLFFKQAGLWREMMYLQEPFGCNVFGPVYYVCQANMVIYLIMWYLQCWSFISLP